MIALGLIAVKMAAKREYLVSGSVLLLGLWDHVSLVECLLAISIPPFLSMAPWHLCSFCESALH